MESGNLGIRIRNTAQGSWNATKNYNPESGQILESIRNPRRAIQNPRLSWIALHGVAVRHVIPISSSSPYMHFLVSGNVGDHGSVEMNATEEEIEIRVIKEDKDVRGSLKAASTTEVQ